MIAPDAEAGSRVISISVGGEDLDHGATYTLTITDFMWTGGDGNLVFVGHECETFGTMDEVVIEAFEDIGVVDASTIEGGRLVAVRRGRPRPAILHARSRTSSTEDRPTVTS